MKRLLYTTILLAGGCSADAGYRVTAFDSNGKEIKSYRATDWRRNRSNVTLWKHDGSKVEIMGCSVIIEELPNDID